MKILYIILLLGLYPLLLHAQTYEDYVKKANELITYQRKYVDAITECNKAIALDPKKSLAYNWRGIAYSRISD